MSEILEVVMVVLFGASWPANVMRSLKSRTAKGKSLTFLILIGIGYVAGVISKLTNAAYMANFQQKWYVLFFYCLNLIMVSTDIVLYFRNKKLDAQRDAGK